ncbi:MAG: Hsp20/alpha crystallin family protein [Deltaproteobacteria bacterium]|nr:Hsp20/alpha crystallin family protein [Deltaproteobacteria bacterium]
MPPTKRDPLRDLLFLQERMSRIFDEALLKYRGGGAANGGWYPPVDIYETEENIILKAELPGVDPESVSIDVGENTLSLRGERKLEKGFTDENYHRMERFYGTFHRAFSLPYPVDGDGVKASFKDGVLKITIPKKRHSGAGSIKVKVT